MKKTRRPNRSYTSELRAQAAEGTQRRILEAARSLFGRQGIDTVTIANIGKKAGVAGSTVYSIYGSKDGILRALMEQALFGSEFQSAQKLLLGEDDPVKLIQMTPRVARAIYESEASDLGLLRHSSGFSPALRKMEQEFERIRFDAQEQRVRSLFDAGKARRGLSLEEARRILWMYTSRDVYRMLVHEAGWTPDRYETWLSTTLLEALVDSRATAR
ncbi:MAG TPA: helix-turn-helix domain-containing protein [Bryobacteraceae bacterium]|nr:helix-turn-helix domain-containing protein [Bryobacteraceae bacterium]